MAKYKKLKISQKSLAIKRDHIYTVKIVVENLIKTLESKAAGNIKFPTNSPDFEWVETNLLLYAKAVKTYRAIYQLCYEGYATEAISLNRVLFEAEINLQIICINGKDMAERFTSFIDYRRYEFYLKQSDKGAIKNLPKGKRKKYIEHIKSKHGMHLQKYPDQKRNKNSWSGLNILERCKLIDERKGTNYKKQYLEIYPYYSSFAHNDIISVSDYIDRSHRIRHIPDLRKIEVVFFDASARILNIIEICAKNLHMASEEFLNEELANRRFLISKSIKIP